jgi:hypothetical protein
VGKNSEKSIFHVVDYARYCQVNSALLYYIADLLGKDMLAQHGRTHLRERRRRKRRKRRKRRRMRRMSVCKYTRTRTHAYIHTRIHTHMHTRVYTYIYAQIHVYVIERTYRGHGLGVLGNLLFEVGEVTVADALEGRLHINKRHDS